MNIKILTEMNTVIIEMACKVGIKGQGVGII